MHHYLLYTHWHEPHGPCKRCKNSGKTNFKCDFLLHIWGGHLGDAALVKELLHLRQVFHVKEPTAANLKSQWITIIGNKESEAVFMVGETDDMFRIERASYLKFCIHSTRWAIVLQMCITPILDPLPLGPLWPNFYLCDHLSKLKRHIYVSRFLKKSMSDLFCLSS